MVNDELNARLRGLIGEEYDALCADFARGGGDGDTEAFLRFLVDRGHLDPIHLWTLHDGEAIGVLDAASLPANHSLASWATAAGLTISEATSHDGSFDEPPPSTEERVAAERYELLGMVGKGAMGEVHLARDLDLLRKVAFKKLTHTNVHPTISRRFVSEVQITAQLDHPNIVPVYGLAIAEDGAPAYAMKLVQGRTLRDVISQAEAQIAEQGRPDESHGLPARLEHFLRVCDALAYAHAKGVVHRDLKPANIMIGRFHEVYVMDWGIARLVDGSLDDPLSEDNVRKTSPIDVSALDDNPATRTRLGAVVGTPAFMSPEQASGEVQKITATSDIYALGLMLFEVCLLRPAYPGRDVREVLRLARKGNKASPWEPPPAEAVSPELVAIIDRATAVGPEHRYQSVSELSEDLRRHLRGDPPHALPDNTPRRLRRWAQRHLMLTITSLLAVLLVSSGLGGAYALRQRAQLAEQRLVAQEHAHQLAEFLTRVQASASRIDRHFLWYEGLVEGLATAAEQSLLHGAPGPDLPYHRRDFLDPSTSPPDLVSSTAYASPVSFEWPVWTDVAGTAEQDWRPQLGLLANLTPLLQSMLRQSPDGIERDLGAPDRPIVWAYVALQDTGLMVIYPGARGLWDDSYDPRQRPWYRDVVSKKGRSWGTPYLDLMGEGRVITCGRSLLDADGALLGVAALDLHFDWVLRRYLAKPEPVDGRLPRFATVTLVDETGAIVATSEAGTSASEAPEELASRGVDLGRYTNDEVLAGLDSGHAGYLAQRSSTGEDFLVAWAPLPQLGWGYIVHADPEALFDAR